MKAVILSAGRGKRFHSLYLPKSLTPLVNKQTILDLQLDLLTQHIPFDDIILVVGYRKEVMLELYPDLLFVYNPAFEEENTAKSLLRALRKIENENVLWMNGDVVCQPRVMEAIFKKKRSSLIVNKSPVGKEEVKYTTSSSGTIRRLSKEVHNAQGEALGINLIMSKDLDCFKKNLERCAKEDYFEKAIEYCIEEGVQFWPVVVGNDECTEVDFPEDLDKANEIITGEK